MKNFVVLVTEENNFPTRIIGPGTLIECAKWIINKLKEDKLVVYWSAGLNVKFIIADMGYVYEDGTGYRIFQLEKDNVGC